LIHVYFYSTKIRSIRCVNEFGVFTFNQFPQIHYWRKVGFVTILKEENRDWPWSTNDIDRETQYSCKKVFSKGKGTESIYTPNKSLVLFISLSIEVLHHILYHYCTYQIVRLLLRA